MGDMKGPVYFFMPDGTKISNDPAFDGKLSAPAEDEVEDQSPSDPEEEGDGLDDMTADQLKEHVKKLREQGVEVDTAGVKKKADLVDAIRAAQSDNS